MLFFNLKLKKTIVSFFAALVVFIPSTLKANEIEEKDPFPYFALLTVPKSGSHMVIKALHLMTGAISIWHTKFPSFHYIPSGEGFLYTHFCLSPQLERDYAELPKLKKIVNIRDLRDVAVSIVNQIKKSDWPGMNKKQRAEFLSSSYDEQLLFAINFDYDVKEVSELAPNSLQVSLSKIAEQTGRYAKDPTNLVCRYENLVGPMGGGTEKAQIEEVRKIASFLEIPISKEQLHEIASQLYGDEINPFGKKGFSNFHSTFHQGQIGSWKKVFKEIHKKAFKEKLGEALIDLGYEEDFCW